MSRASLARLGVLSLMWGSSFLFVNRALLGLSPPQVVLGRLTTGALVLLSIAVVRRQRLPRDPRMWGHLALMGVVANVAPFTLIAFGQERITSGLAGVLNATTPLFTLAIALAALPEERLSTARGLGLALGLGGVVVIVGPDAVLGGVAASLVGQVACLAAACCYGIGFVYARRVITPRGYAPLALSASQLLAAATVLWLASPLVATGPISLSPVVVASVLALGGMGTGLAYLVYYRLIADAGATSTSMVTYLIPVVAVTLGVVVLGEPVGWNLLVGVVVVIAGVALAEGRLDRFTPFGPAKPQGARPTVEAPAHPNP